jgi:hypothetical protein
VEEPADEVIQRELGKGERLLWSGRPRQGLMLRPVDAFLIPFSVLWGGFAIFWEISVIVARAPWDFVAWGVPFVLVGLYIIFGRFVLDAWQRARTFYGVTSERVVIVSGLMARQVKSVNLDMLSEVTLTERANGSGTITLGRVSSYSWPHGAAGWPGFGNSLVPTIELSDGARDAYEIIRGAQRSLR